MYIVEKYVHGFKIIKRNHLAVRKMVSVDKSVSSRGQIRAFSGKSSARLRDLLLTHCPKDSLMIPISITCTCPEVISPSEWRAMLKRFTTNLNRYGLGLIWRVELQRRKVPHLHCLGYVRSIVDVGDYWLAWVNACGSMHPQFLLYGFLARYCLSDNWFVYMATHATKHKGEQLGWLGRQWGVINRSFFDTATPVRSIVCVHDSLPDSVIQDRLDFDISQFVNCSVVRFGSDDDLYKELIELNDLPF